MSEKKKSSDKKAPEPSKVEAPPVRADVVNPKPAKAPELEVTRFEKMDALRLREGVTIDPDCDPYWSSKKNLGRRKDMGYVPVYDDKGELVEKHDMVLTQIDKDRRKRIRQHSLNRNALQLGTSTSDVGVIPGDEKTARELAGVMAGLPTAQKASGRKVYSFPNNPLGK